MRDENRPRRPGIATLCCGVIFPAAVILFELFTGMCADALFDPLPTPGHLLLVSAVPAINLLLWLRARREETPRRWVLAAGGASIAISTAYGLLMLPVLPIALVAIIVMGIGILPYAPVLAGVFAARWTSDLASRVERSGWPVALGAVAALLALVAVDLPATATFLALESYRGTAAEQQRSLWLMRTIGDREMLLRLAYGETSRATGLMSFLATSWNRGFDGRLLDADNESARELYFRVTGTPFNAVPAPSHGLSERRRWVMNWDEDQGGEAVGRRVAGLTLAGSRIDGSIASADNLGYFEWTADFTNADPIAHEVRMTIALPEGAVASRATLWVNGEPREASVAARGDARAAYADVVSAQRDPLLVTTDGAQRLLVQAFPVNAGSSLKLRVGFTAPFAIAPDGSRSLALPAIVERNFELAPDLRHSVWIESDAMLASGDTALQPGGTGNGLHGEPTDDELVRRRPRILASKLVAPLVHTGSVPAMDKQPALGVKQEIAPATVSAPTALAIVLDGSAGNAKAAAALKDMLGSVPARLPVSLVIADDELRNIAAAPWSPAQQARFSTAIAATSFDGGKDDIPALTAAARNLAGGGGAILWIHGPQPVDFMGGKARLEQFVDRVPVLPRLIRYQPEPGRALTLAGVRWFDEARMVSPSSDARRDLRAILEGFAAGTRWQVTRSEVPASGSEGSANIVRLWAADRIIAAESERGDARKDAVSLANRLNLVTPLSGAVVLESDKQTQDKGLPVPNAEDVPTIPEPREWALLLLAAAMLGWLFRKRIRLPRLMLRTAA